MDAKHLYSVELRNEGGIHAEDDRNLDDFTDYLKSGEATLLNGQLEVDPEDLISVKEIPNINTQPID